MLADYQRLHVRLKPNGIEFELVETPTEFTTFRNTYLLTFDKVEGTPLKYRPKALTRMIQKMMGDMPSSRTYEFASRIVDRLIPPRMTSAIALEISEGEVEVVEITGEPRRGFGGILAALGEIFSGPSGPHKHKCQPCDVVWEHDTSKIKDDSEAYAKAHLCPRCGAKVTRVYHETEAPR